MRKKLLTGLTIVFFMAGMSGVASATVLEWDLDLEFSGAQEPEGSTPWLEVTISDESPAWGDVTITLSASGLIEEESVDKWYFNLDPALNVDLLFGAYDASAPVSSVDWKRDEDNLKADGVGGYFDFYFDFVTGDFIGGEEVTIWLDYAGGVDLTANSFNFGSMPLDGNNFLTAAHVQSIDIFGNDNEGSGWIAGGGTPVNEPATMLLFGTGLVGLAGFRRGKKR